MKIPMMIKLPQTFTPQRAMADPRRLRIKLAEYFDHLSEHDQIPTPAGLALALGLRSFDSVLYILKTEENEPGSFPEESLNILYTSAAQLEDMYLQMGLREQIHPQFTKYILSAYMNRSEKTIQETQSSGESTIRVEILGISTPHTISTEDQIQRLEQAKVREIPLKDPNQSPKGDPPEVVISGGESTNLDDLL